MFLHFKQPDVIFLRQHGIREFFSFRNTCHDVVVVEGVVFPASRGSFPGVR